MIFKDVAIGAVLAVTISLFSIQSMESDVYGASCNAEWTTITCANPPGVTGCTAIQIPHADEASWAWNHNIYNNGGSTNNCMQMFGTSTTTGAAVACSPNAAQDNVGVCDNSPGGDPGWE